MMKQYRIILLIFTLLFLSWTFLITKSISQSGIEPSSFQGTPYKGGVMVGVTPIIDEFTGDTIYLYQHSDTSFVKIDSLVFTDSLRLYTSQGVFTTYISSGGGSGDITAVTVSAPITGGGTSGSVNIGIDTTSITGAATQYDISLLPNQTLSQSFTGTTQATYTLSNSGGSVVDTTGYMRLETMDATAGQRLYRYKSNLGSVMGMYEGAGTGNIEILRSGNILTWGLKTTGATNGKIWKYNGSAWSLADDASGISSLNGLTPSTQTFSISTSSLGFGVTSSGSTHTFNLPYTEDATGIRLGNNAKLSGNSVALGNNAGDTGCGNCFALGKDVLSNVTTASNNLGIGLQALYSQQTGGNNIGIGNYANYFGTSTSNSIFIGESSGLNNLTGSDNVFIGRLSGRNNTGSSNVFIGANAGFSETGSNKLYIANSTTSTPLIGGDFSASAATINGSLTVTTRTGTATQLLGNDPNGKLINLGLTGVYLSGGNLVGAAPLSGTLNAIPYFNTTTTLGSMPITYSTALPAMVFPSGNAIHLVGTATIIDKANSYGGVGKFLSKPSDGSGGVLWDNPTFTIRNGSGGSSTGFAILPNNILDIQAGQNMEVETDFTSSTNPKLTLNAITYYAQLSNNALITPTLDNTNRIVDFGIANESNNTQVDADITTNLITADVSGDYEITYNLSYTLPTPALRDVTFKIYKAGSDIGYNYTAYSTHLSSTSSVWTPVGKTFHVFLTAGETIGLYYISSGSSTTINIASPVLSLKKLD